VSRPGAVAIAIALVAALGAGTAEAQSLGVRELQAEAARLLQELASLRGIPSPAPAPRVVVRTRDERRRFVVGEFQRKYPAGRLDAERRAMVAWGLIPPGFDLTGFLADLVVEQAAAYYDPVGKVMVLANWLPADAQREALAHELVHALQDRQADLDRFLATAPGRGDAGLARQALVEGEAVALTMDRTLRRLGQDLASLSDVTAFRQAIARSGTGPALGQAPRFLRALLTFPYTEGLGFVHQFRRRHPWSEVSRLYADPPRSTTQILHPERYLDRREDPLALTLPDLAPILGAGARRVLEDEAGEFGFGGILAEFLGDGATASGWRGDRYALWDVGGAAALVSVSAWESEAAAAAFAAAYARLLDRKHGLGAPATAIGEFQAWRAPDGAFAVERRRREVLAVERVAPGALDALRQAVWASRAAAGRRSRQVSGPTQPRHFLGAPRPRPVRAAGFAAATAGGNRGGVPTPPRRSSGPRPG
jgi:hypothetical protein